MTFLEIFMLNLGIGLIYCLVELYLYREKPEVKEIFSQPKALVMIGVMIAAVFWFPIFVIGVINALSGKK